MTDKPDETPDAPDTAEPDNTPDAPDTDEPEEWTPPDKDTWDKQLRINEARKAERAEARKQLSELKAELARLKGGKDKPEEPSEADMLRDGIKRTAARAVLATVGVTDKDDQAALLDVLKLDGVEIVDGEADTEALEERLSELRRILGAPAATEKTRRPKVTTRDLGGSKAEPADPDRARRLRFLQGGRV